MPRREQTSTRPAAVRLSLDPRVLRAASIERLGEAELVHSHGRWACSAYLSGLAVESLLQSFAGQVGAAHDARHDLRSWLAKSPGGVLAAITARAGPEWSLLTAMWSNDLRYLSEDGLLGWIRRKRLHGRIRGGRESILRTCSRRCLESARLVHSKGLVAWQALS